MKVYHRVLGKQGIGRTHRKTFSFKKEKKAFLDDKIEIQAKRGGKIIEKISHFFDKKHQKNGHKKESATFFCRTARGYFFLNGKLKRDSRPSKRRWILGR